jgi:large subunit ribosomal protein L21e
MGHSHGYRSRTRHSFSKAFGKKGGNIHLTQYLTPLRVGDYVDVKANGSVHKGMPHKFYHGKTGIVYNVTKRAVGVEINKAVRNRIMKKRINLRVEHVHPSKCRLDFLARVQKNDAIKRQAKKEGKVLPIEMLKRFFGTPKGAFTVPAASAHGLPTLVAPLAFDEMI